MAETRVYFNPIFKQANETRCRYRCMRGSAGSGKSVNIAQDYILKLMNPKYKGDDINAEVLHKEELVYENIEVKTRSYK